MFVLNNNFIYFFDDIPRIDRDFLVKLFRMKCNEFRTVREEIFSRYGNI